MSQVGRHIYAEITCRRNAFHISLPRFAGPIERADNVVVCNRAAECIIHGYQLARRKHEVITEGWMHVCKIVGRPASVRWPANSDTAWKDCQSPGKSCGSQAQQQTRGLEWAKDRCRNRQPEVRADAATATARENVRVTNKGREAKAQRGKKETLHERNCNPRVS